MFSESKSPIRDYLYSKRTQRNILESSAYASGVEIPLEQRNQLVAPQGDPSHEICRFLLADQLQRERAQDPSLVYCLV